MNFNALVGISKIVYWCELQIYLRINKSLSQIKFIKSHSTMKSNYVTKLVIQLKFYNSKIPPFTLVALSEPKFSHSPTFSYFSFVNKTCRRYTSKTKYFAMASFLERCNEFARTRTGKIALEGLINRFTSRNSLILARAIFWIIFTLAACVCIFRFWVATSHMKSDDTPVGIEVLPKPDSGSLPYFEGAKGDSNT